MTIRINALPEATNPAASSFLAVDGATTEKATLQKVVDAGAPVASEAEARAGVDNAKRMTALRVKQSIDEEIGNTIASAASGALANTAVQPGDLGDSATLDVGTTAGTVAAGDDDRFGLAVASLQFRSTKNAIALLDPTITKSAALSEDDIFYWSPSDLSDWVDRDPTRSVLIPPSTDTSGASGAWVRKGPWQLGTVYATWFGVKADSDGTAGNGTDNAAAIQAAIDFVAPFVWKGTTRLTELQGNASGTVILPKGVMRFASKLKLAPNLTLRGQGCGNDFTVRTGIGGAASGPERMGSALFADIADFGTYALDTCPYDDTGTRLDDATQLGGDSYDGVRTQVPNVRIESLTLYGNWTCKGVNLAGAESSKVASDVLIRGFVVGLRYSASWYAKMAGRVLYSWRGLIAYMAVTDVDISGASFWRSVEAPVYDPTVSGWDGTEPATDSWWTVDVKKRSAAVYNLYGNIVGTNVALEFGDYQFMSKNGVADIRGIYTEQTQHGVIFTEGPDQQNERYAFDTISTSTAPLIFAKNARLEIGAQHHNYTQNGFGRVIGDLFNTLGYEGIPVLNGIKLKGADSPFTEAHIAYGSLRENQGEWTPVLKFGGDNADDGTGLFEGDWVRHGNTVYLIGHIAIGALTSATGAMTIEGLPFRIKNRPGLDPPANLSFYYGTPNLRAGRGVAGGYSIAFDGFTNTGFTNDADIRFQMIYATDEYGPWGW